MRRGLSIDTDPRSLIGPLITPLNQSEASIPRHKGAQQIHLKHDLSVVLWLSSGEASVEDNHG